MKPYRVGETVSLSKLDPERKHTPRDVAQGQELIYPAEGCRLKVQVVKGEPAGRRSALAGRILKVLPPQARENDDDSD